LRRLCRGLHGTGSRAEREIIEYAGEPASPGTQIFRARFKAPYTDEKNVDLSDWALAASRMRW
jgi:hypothetical protein